MFCTYNKANSIEPDEENHLDPCTGFPTTHKAKLSIPSVSWNKWWQERGTNGDSPSQTFTSEKLPLPENTHPQKCQSWIGVIFTILSALTFSFTALFSKILSHLDPFNLATWTFLLMTVISGVHLIIWKFVANRRLVDKTTQQSTNSLVIYLLIRAFTGVAALLFFFCAVKYLTVADAIVIDATCPIFVYILAFLFLGEKFGVIPVISAILAFAGVGLIARPPLFSNQADLDIKSLIGVMFALSTVICISISIIALKFLNAVDISLINFFFSFVGALGCSLISWINDTLAVPLDVDIPKIVFTASLFYTGQLLMTIALKYIDAGPVGLVRTTELVFVFLWQFLFLGVMPDGFSWCGTTLVLLGVFLTLARNWIQTLPESSTA